MKKAGIDLEKNYAEFAMKCSEIAPKLKSEINLLQKERKR